MSRISVVIPTLNEGGILRQCLNSLLDNCARPDEMDIIVSDGSSTDDTASIARELGAEVVACPVAQRAKQLNAGCVKAASPILYVLHADTIPPHHFDESIRKAVEAGFDSGCFRMRFDNEHPIMRLYAWFTRFNFNIFRGGDQSLFLRKELFERIRGYNEGLDLMEDYDMVRRLQKTASFAILKDEVITSARKYAVNGIIRLQWIFGVIQFMYRTGYSQKSIKRFYLKHIRS